ncbi:MAG: ABC transporter ATP-binding protein [Anaerolineae bacterium]|jgi:ABC-2 type transport system ATP-binding protein/lipopolysaccharide transport system ATP-binding protein|nr:ABC transporter ATP-binding protein [Anaerolineae bacterium]
MNPVITVENVSKRYRFQSYRPSLRQEFGQMVKRLVGKTDQVSWEEKPFWSLRNISFTLNAGDSLGIIGPNGAGKTTLLRLLSGIIEPTEGHIEVVGNFAPLIGLGAGFDHERTGRENIYLNAAIQGVPIPQIDRAMPDIIEFTELGEFIDRPVKIYSSGMVGRLGFAIASILTPDIVFLDEVFSVGDIGFQSKSMERILAFKERKTTLVFISHSLDAVQKLCARTLWLEHGQVQMDGPTDAVVAAYQTARAVREGM